jgi:hypothetical protein
VEKNLDFLTRIIFAGFILFVFSAFVKVFRRKNVSSAVGILNVVLKMKLKLSLIQVVKSVKQVNMQVYSLLKAVVMINIVSLVNLALEKGNALVVRRGWIKATFLILDEIFRIF